MKNFIVYTKLDAAAHKVIKIKADDHIFAESGKLVKFNASGNQVAVFNMSELVGFVLEDNVVN